MKKAGENGTANDTGSRSRWKAALRILVRTAMILACIWLVALIAVQIVLSPKMVDRLIDRYASEYVDGQIHIGKASMSVFRHFPNIGMTLEDFGITYPADRYDSLEVQGAQGHLALKGLGADMDTLASFSRLSASINVAALVSGKINIPYAELVRPRIFIHRYADGSSNIDIIRMPADTTKDEEEGGEMPELKLGRIGLSDHPHIVYTDSKDTIFAVADLKQVRLNGRLNPAKSSRNRVGIRLDSLFVAGRISADTLAFGLEQLGIRERQKQMQMHAKARALLATRAFGRMHIPIEIRSGFSFPKNDVPAIEISGLKAEIASVPLSGGGSIRLLEDRASLKAFLSVEECKASDVIDGFLRNYIPALKDISTDASVSIAASCEGDYIYSDGTLPAFKAHISVPESEISHKAIDNRLRLRLDASAVHNPADSCISASVDTIEIRSNGLDFKASGNIPDIMEEDMLISIHGDLDADIAQLRTFLPDTMDIEATGTMKAHLLGDIRMSQMDIYSFSQARLEGTMEGQDIRIRMPADSIDIDISSFGIELGPETKTSKIDSTKRFDLMAIKGTVDNADISYGLLDLSGKGITVSAMNSANGNEGKVGRLGGRLTAKNLIFNDASGMEVELRETANGFQMYPKRENPDIPVLTVSSDNKHIYYKDGTNRAILTDADIYAMAAMNTIERKQKARMFMDSLARMYPEVPRDSLMRHAFSKIKARELPEWMSEEDFRKKDINIKLDETLAKYFREWDMNGKLDIRTGIVMTPYFPLTNIIRGFEVQFDNDRIAIDSVKFRSGKSEIAGKGELTGLRRALLGRGGLYLDLAVISDKINANELLTAYNTGSRYTPPKDRNATESATDAEFLKMVVKDTVNVADSVTPLIVIPSNLNAEIKLDASDITYSDITVSELEARLTMKERCVQVTETKAVSNIGDISFEGFYATRSKKNIKAGFSFNFEDITAEKVIDMIPAVDSIMPMLKSFNGNLNCELAATAGIDTNMNIIPPSINGVIRINGRDLSIKESEMFRSLAKKLMFKNKNEGYIKEMSVEGVISDSVLEVFPFVLKLDRYTLALSGIQNLDQSFKYHASLLKSPFLIRLGIDLHGKNFDDMNFKIGKAKYKNTDVPVFSAVIDTTKINLVKSIRGIFEKGVEAAISENEQKAAIENHKQKIGYVRAVDQELEALSEKEQKQMEAEEAVLKETEAAEEALGKAIQQISLNLPVNSQEEKDKEKQEKK